MGHNSVPSIVCNPIVKGPLPFFFIQFLLGKEFLFTEIQSIVHNSIKLTYLLRL